MAITLLLLLNDPEIKDIVTQAISGLPQGEGIDVFCVGEGQAALDLLNEMTPDLLIAEIFMPGKNGIAICRYAKQEPLLQDMRVLLLDEYFEPFREQVAYNIGADVYLGKPFEVGELSEHIWRLSGREGVATGGETADEGAGKSMAASTTGPVQEVTKRQGSAPAAPVAFVETRQISAPAPSSAERRESSGLPEPTPPRAGKAKLRSLYAVIAAVLLTITGLAVAMRDDRPQAGITVPPALPAASPSRARPQPLTTPEATAAGEAKEKPADDGSDPARASQTGSRAMKSSGANAAAAPVITKVGKNLAGGVKTIGVGGARATAKAGRKVGGAFKRIF